MNSPISEEMINAYIDQELAPKDILLIENEIQNDGILQAKVEELQKLKQEVKNIYLSTLIPPKRKYKLSMNIAASITLFLGLVTGWYTHDYIQINHSSTAYLLGIKLTDVNPEDNKIIIHLSENDLKLFDNALTKAETFLAYYKTIKKQGKVHVLANSYGMDILRTHTSPYKERITQMMKTYDNVEFIACKNTLKRLESSGKDTNLLPGVKVHGPVINEIISSLQNGWTYINI